MLSSYRRLGGGRFLVYFDGDDPGGSAFPPGVAVRYSAPVSTDEAILRRLREVRKPAEVIVVTNDRGLMSRCRSAGASVLAWSEFVAKMQSRRNPHTKRDEQMDKVDVEDWIKYFGYKEQ